jgi:hypothetical protein
MIQIKIGDHPIDLMGDTGMTHSVVTQPVGPLSQRHATIVGATGYQTCHTFLVSRKCNLGKHEVRHEFLYLPDSPVDLTGRDLLCKLRAQITFDSDGIAALKLRGPEAKIMTLTTAQEEEWQLCASKKEIPEMPELPFKILGVWVEDNLLELAQNIPPVVVELKLGAIPVSQRQYYIPARPRLGSKSILTDS